MVNVLKIIQAGNIVRDTAEYRAALSKVRNDPAWVTFVLDRRGKVRQTMIEQPTGSDMLDRMVLRIVSSRQYPPFPNGAWPGEPTHSFRAPFKFR
jgi:TonB family protein